jgi:TRAP-type C4-dicarboxylate transport system permease small subunit
VAAEAGEIHLNANTTRMATTWIERVNAVLSKAIRLICGVLLVLMVVFTVYTVVMRYVFQDPPFWGDTLSVFCNIWVTMLGYSLAVRDREDIALRGFYKFIPPLAGFLLDMLWSAMVFFFGLYLVWFGWDAARNVPGMFLELGGLKKMYPMLVMPIAGALVAMAASMLILEDVLILMGKRASRNLAASGQEVI